MCSGRKASGESMAISRHRQISNAVRATTTSPGSAREQSARVIP
ncbi:hypothetical protein AHiyo4_46330 [Arthrobacter sp. Hiyo4]|nr:hypothetical protein AHiyo4_46330 [Arthrobacter sp. Hiyo4]